MSTELTLPKGFGAVSSIFANTKGNNELGQGIASSYGVMGYRGKVWAVKYQGKETPLMRADGDGARGSIDVVIVKANGAISKIFYKDGYKDGSNEAPTCWSANGQVPDSSVQNKQSSSCATCPMNAWGSRVTEAGKPGKACSDSRRVAIVPLEDMGNEMFGGPMLLRIPAASLKELKAYGDLMDSYQFPYYAVATRISFDPKEAYPKFVFQALRPLDDNEARFVMGLRDDKRVAQVLSEAPEVGGEHEAPAVEQKPASPFLQAAAPAAAPKAAAPKPAAAPKAAAPKAAPKPQPVIETPDEEVFDTPQGKTPASFDDMLEDIL